MERVTPRQLSIKEIDVDRKSERARFFVEVATDAMKIRNEIQAQLEEGQIMSPTTLVVGKDFMAYFWLSHSAEVEDLYGLTGNVPYVDTTCYKTFGESFSLLHTSVSLPPRVTVVVLDEDNWKDIKGSPFEITKRDDYEILFYHFSTGREVEAFVCF